MFSALHAAAPSTGKGDCGGTVSSGVIGEGVTDDACPGHGIARHQNFKGLCSPVVRPVGPGILEVHPGQEHQAAVIQGEADVCCPVSKQPGGGAIVTVLNEDIRQGVVGIKRRVLHISSPWSL